MADTPTRILLVDDDLYIRDLYEEVLSSAGFTVEIAKDGKEGYEKITQQSYSLVLLDVMLPQLDGIGILTQLKEANQKHPPIILMTNLSKDPVLKQAAELGAIRCVTKADVNPGQLLEIVQQTIGVKQPEQKTPAGATPGQAVPEQPPSTPKVSTETAAEEL